jgi:hypothetical protein
MEERRIRGILAQYKSFKTQAESQLSKGWNLDNQLTVIEKIPYENRTGYEEENIKGRINKFLYETKSLIQFYNQWVQGNSKEIGLTLSIINQEGEEASLQQIIIECDKVIGALEDDIAILSNTDKTRLDDLSKEATKVCENLDSNFSKNVSASIEELEKGHLLASALITSRIIDFVFSQILGDNINEKIKTIIEKKVVQKDDENSREQIIKANKKARNYLNHRIDTFPEPSQSLSLLGDCIFLLTLFLEYQNKLEK